MVIVVELIIVFTKANVELYQTSKVENSMTWAHFIWGHFY